MAVAKITILRVREDIVIALDGLKFMYNREIAEFNGRWKKLLQIGISSVMEMKPS